MKIHHLNCGTMCPLGCHGIRALADAAMICHCLAIETNEGLILVDTGFGTDDIKNPSRLGISSRLFGWDHNPSNTAINHLAQLGFRATDVRHIVLTHLDLDHAGGIADFPQAQIHTLAPELQAALARRGFIGKSRYRPVHWSHQPKWQTHRLEDGEAWMGFHGVRPIIPAISDLLLVPLIGHTAGHLGVAIQTGSQQWLFHVGDSYYSRNELNQPQKVSLVFRYLRWTAHHDRRKTLDNQRQLTQLTATQPGITLCSSHDPGELNSFMPVK